MMKTLLCTVALTFLTVPMAKAMDRYYCAVDDAQVKISVDIGFKEAAGWPLGHLRGILLLKPGPNQQAEKPWIFDGESASQVWRDGEVMRIVVANPVSTTSNFTQFLLQVESEAIVGTPNRFSGRYRSSVQHMTEGELSAPATLKGKINCARF